MGRRLRKADQKLTSLAFLDVCGRLANFLMTWAKDRGKKMYDRSIRAKLPTHQFIADQIGLSREAVTKTMKSLSSQEIIFVKNKEIIIQPEQFDFL